MCLLFCHCWLTWKFEYPVVWLQPCLFTQNIEYKRHGSRCQVHLVRGNYRWGWSSAGMNKVLQKMNQELRQCTNIKSNSSGGGPHRPWRNVARRGLEEGFASLYLDLTLVDLSGVGSVLPRATPAEVVQVKSRSDSASPRRTWTWPVLPQPGSVRSASATVRFTLIYRRLS